MRYSLSPLSKRMRRDETNTTDLDDNASASSASSSSSLSSYSWDDVGNSNTNQENQPPEAVNNNIPDSNGNKNKVPLAVSSKNFPKNIEVETVLLDDFDGRTQNEKLDGDSVFCHAAAENLLPSKGQWMEPNQDFFEPKTKNNPATKFLRVTTILHDDDSSDDDNSKSVIVGTGVSSRSTFSNNENNLRPSPGHWMEPNEDFVAPEKQRTVLFQERVAVVVQTVLHDDDDESAEGDKYNYESSIIGSAEPNKNLLSSSGQWMEPNEDYEEDKKKKKASKKSSFSPVVVVTVGAKNTSGDENDSDGDYDDFDFTRSVWCDRHPSYPMKESWMEPTVNLTAWDRSKNSSFATPNKKLLSSRNGVL